VSPGDATQETLRTFPNPKIIEAGENAKNEVAAEAERMLAAAVELNQRQLLVPNSLPAPRGTEPFTFRDRYHWHMENQMRAAIKAGSPPTQQEIEARAAQLWETQYKPEIFRTGSVTNEKEIADAFNAAKAKLPEQMRTEVALRSRVYADLTAFDIIGGKEIPKTGPAPETHYIWWAQIGLWIQEDVLATINEMNGTGENVNVMNAPFKRLIRIDAPKQFVPAGPEGGELPKVTTVSFTGRASNALFDVAHFRVVADIEAEKLPLFFETLGRNRFITVLSTDVVSLDNAEQKAMGFIYGDRPVVRVTVIAEKLFFRKWTTQYMPDGIKRLLKITEPQPGM
jgi:hypothetical protein